MFKKLVESLYKLLMWETLKMKQYGKDPDF